ncbi:hypothetical protein BRC83_06235 [Halobacteriales archaeon QS_1_68_17]|nr:MAG: hypothetical protein BRC83_06235 [Halobacteriales archaeon QS_1_68_17]
MPTFDADPERITAFRVDDRYLFAHYFEREDLFDRLREYYDGEQYRFAVPADEFPTVRADLAEEYVEFEVVEDLEPYCVVKEQYTEHADILRDSVAHWERRGHLFFLLESELAVREAVERGATPVAETDFVVGL